VNRDELRGEYLTPNDVAEMLGVSVKTLASWRSTKRYPLPFVRVGRCIRYRRTDLEEFLEKRREATTL